jgi:hypothetical protein
MRQRVGDSSVGTSRAPRAWYRMEKSDPIEQVGRRRRGAPLAPPPKTIMSQQRWVDVFKPSAVV